MSSSASRRLRRSQRPLVSGRRRDTDASPLSFDPKNIDPQNPKQLENAVATCRLAIRLKPDWAEAHACLGDALVQLRRLEEAIASYRRALALQPDLADRLRMMAGTMMCVGQYDEAVAAYRRLIRLEPDHEEASNNLLFIAHYHPDYDARTLLAEHRRWAHRFADPLAREIRPASNDRSPDRRLRIGFLGKGFLAGPQELFLRPLFQEYDRTQYEFICYSDTLASDAVTAKLRGLTDAWYDTAGLSDRQLAIGIHADRIDVLVDLQMHTPRNRLLVFARKPAPVQVTACETISTTGVGTMDYRLTDPYLDPPGETDGDYTERSIRLPHCFWCYRAPDDTPPVAESPALRNGFLTFGSLNNPLKANRATRLLWAPVLMAVPTAKMIIHAPTAYHEAQTRAVLEGAGVTRDRISFVPYVPRLQYFQRYCDFDVVLDTIPFAGGTTTFDALWMGVPVVTLAGRTGVGRGGVSILSNIGLPELIARTPEEYIDIAAELARDLDRLAALRAGMRERMKASPLMNGKQYAADVEAAFRAMWKSWCAGPGPSRREAETTDRSTTS